MKISLLMIYCLLEEDAKPKDPDLCVHDAMPGVTACIRIHKQSQVKAIEIIQYGLLDDQHCLITKCSICNCIDVYKYELHHEQQ